MCTVSESDRIEQVGDDLVGVVPASGFSWHRGAGRLLSGLRTIGFREVVGTGVHQVDGDAAVRFGDVDETEGHHDQRR